MKTIEGQLVKAFYDCACGCEQEVRSEKAVFLLGHDAKLVSRLANMMKIAFGSGDDAAVYGLEQKAKYFSPALQGKIAKAFANAKGNTLAKAKARQKAMNAVLFQTVKVGRWEYPAKHVDGEWFRNAKRDGTGEWIRYEGEVAA